MGGGFHSLYGDLSIFAAWRWIFGIVFGIGRIPHIAVVFLSVSLFYLGRSDSKTGICTRYPYAVPEYDAVIGSGIDHVGKTVF